MTAQADRLERPALREVQRRRLGELFAEALSGNAFWDRKFAAAGFDPARLIPDDFPHLPCTTKAELLADQEAHPPYGSGLTYPLADYSRLHQTSGTSGRPLRWLDTRQTWSWMLDCWDTYFAVMGLNRDDRLFFPFSFGPFLGFWTAFDAATRRGLFCVPGGGMNSSARLRFLLDHGITVLFCTPTYALRLAEVAQAEGIDLPSAAVRALVVAGEPGGSIPEMRSRLESAWGARVFDHSGMTEIGPAAIACQENPGGLHVLETDYIAEIIDPETLRPVDLGQPGELVLTNLGRGGSPLFRYRTGDLVRADPGPCPCGRALLRLDGGILGRCDDMIHLRGNNVYPAALEALLRRFPEVAEYRIAIDRSAALPRLCIEVEPRPDDWGGVGDLLDRLDGAFRSAFLFRAELRPVPPGSLPRFEMKARRVVQISHHGTTITRERQGETP
jgi:phenylacetate-CoA ligase